MQGVVKFKREKNRTPEDIFRQMIMPKLPLALNVVCQQIVHYARHNHTYQNRTGALENSITWIPAKIQGPKIIAIVLAGGLSKAQFDYADTTVFYRDDQGRLRVFENKEGMSSWYAVHKGDPIFVDYAMYVENKGYPVLKHAIERFRHRVAEIAGQEIKKEVIPRANKYRNEAGGG